jgi:hypothetical protein
MELGAIPDGTLFVVGRHVFRVRRDGEAHPATRAAVGAIFQTGAGAVTELGPTVTVTERVDVPFADVALKTALLPAKSAKQVVNDNKKAALASEHYAD